MAIPGPATAPAAAPTPPATAAAYSALNAERDSLEFEVVQASIYHREREAFFNGLQRALTFFTLVASSGAVAALLGNQASLAGWVSVFAAGCSAFSLVFDLNGRTRAHSDLRRKYHELAVKLASGIEPASIRNDLIRLGAESPPPLVNVALDAHRSAALALGRVVNPDTELPRFRRVLRHFGI